MGLGPDIGTCKQCSQPLPSGALAYCKASCSSEAKRERDRKRKRTVRGYAFRNYGKVDPGEFIERDTPSKKLPDLQPRALTLVQKRAIEFVKWLGHDLTDQAARFCFMRGYSQLDMAEIIKSLHGEIQTAPEEIPPDPPEDVDPELSDPFGD